jgi:hypothetical protein
MIATTKPSATMRWANNQENGQRWPRMGNKANSQVARRIPPPPQKMCSVTRCTEEYTHHLVALYCGRKPPARRKNQTKIGWQQQQQELRRKGAKIRGGR